MRKVVTLLLVGFACAFANPTWAVAASQPNPGQVIYPTGSSATDLSNVQTAVNSGGAILLKAASASGTPTAFEFDSGRVRLTNDVAITGETLNGNMTTIRHGFLAFRSQFGLRADVSIRGIHFDSPRSAAVLITWSRGFDFSDNVVTDVVGTPAFPGFTKGQAVWVTEGTIVGAIVGQITIVNNVVERVYADLSYGVALARLDAEATIIGNTFRDTKDTGILAVKSSRLTTIEDNTIVGGPPDPGFNSSGNGIFTGQGQGGYLIRRNTVVTDNPLADGISLSGLIDLPAEVPASSVVEHNSVTMHGSQFGGITIYGTVQPSLIASNRVEGDGAYALDISPIFGDEVCDGTVFRGNNISHFQASVADVFLDTVAHDTVFVGHSGIVVDNGFNNRITGFSSLAGGVGSAMQAAHEQKRQFLQTVGALAADDPG